MYEFYTQVYGGTALGQEEFSECLARAKDKLGQLRRYYTVSGGQDAESMALCAMAEAISYFDAAQNGRGGLRYASVGTVSVSGKGIYSQVDISPKAQEKELYRCACRYLDICRGVEQLDGP